MTTKIERTLERSYTVAELIEELNGMNPEARVVFATDYGDHCHTTMALPIKSVERLGGEEYLRETAYSYSGVGIYERDYEGEVIPPESIEVVVLR